MPFRRISLRATSLKREYVDVYLSITRVFAALLMRHEVVMEGVTPIRIMLLGASKIPASVG